MWVPFVKMSARRLFLTVTASILVKAAALLADLSITPILSPAPAILVWMTILLVVRPTMVGLVSKPPGACWSANAAAVSTVLRPPPFSGNFCKVGLLGQLGLLKSGPSIR